MPQQAKLEHPFPDAKRYGWGWRQRLYEAWLVLTRRSSLHVAWQAGYDKGHQDELYRTIVMGGR